MNQKFRVGVVSFADSRFDQAMASEAHQYIYEQHGALVQGLRDRGFLVADPQALEGDGGGETFSPITTRAKRNQIIGILQSEQIDAIVIGCWRWSEPMPVVDLVRKLNLPTALYGLQNADWSGFGGITAIGSALWEVAPNPSAISHLRILDDLDELSSWARGVCAYQRLRNSKLLLWGGVICMGMEHLLDDISQLKAWVVGDVVSEGQYYLIKRAEEFLADGTEIDEFINWMLKFGTDIIYDQKVLTHESLRRQIALYLACEQRIDENDRESVAGVSILCHKELSVEYGVTPCLIPALVPFPENHRGPKRAIPAVCEGDLKSLITSVLLDYISPTTPAQFGDLREINDAPNWIVIANCGGSSLFYAANSNKPEETMPEVTLQPQIHGVSGAAITFKGKGGKYTIARLSRVRGSYWMHLGVGDGVEVTDEIMGRRKWAKEWPTVIVDMGVNTNDFVKVAASNHYLLIPGDHTIEIMYACREAGIPVLRIDTTEGVKEAVEMMIQRSDRPPW
jgi:L-fucose isomerase-like protein